MQVLHHKPLRIIWLKAAVLGSLWASVEILLGSFLHNLKVPFSGSFLAMMAVVLMVGFLQFWKDRGLIWRAGLIAALMKSISPSAVILGPMVGIFTEALLMEMSIRLLGRNLPAYLIGGGMALAGTLVHKAINLLILYGFDLVKVLEALVDFAAITLNWQGASLLQPLAVLSALYILAGIGAALVGYTAGKQSEKKASQISKEPLFGHDKNALSRNSELFSRSSRQRYSGFMIFLNLVILAFLLMMINKPPLILGIAATGGYLVFCHFRYQRAIQRLKKPSFWIPFIVITLLAAILLDGISSGQLFSSHGLMVGLRMNVRAMVIVTGFSAISTELKNPTIRMILYNRGFASVYQALNLSFSALPALLDFISGSKQHVFRPRFVFPKIRLAAQSLLKQFEVVNTNRSPIVMIVGKIGQGKTTHAGHLVKALQQMGISCGGFLARGHTVNGQRSGFSLQPVEEDETTPFSTMESRPGWPSYGRFNFNPKALYLGKKLLKQSADQGREMLMIDEVGPWELNDEGWAESISYCLEKRKMLHCWVVRQSLWKKVARKWDVGNVYVFHIEKDGVDDIVKHIARLLDKSSVRSSQPTE